MPNPIFFHLPDSKRQRLMDAIWAEFTSVSYMEVSINRIIQEAGISRGSFYQYFSGKQDVFTYLLSTIFDTVKNMFLAQLTAHSNDLFDAVLGMYDLMLWRKRKARKSVDLEHLEQLIRLNANFNMSQFTDFFQQRETDTAALELLCRSGYDVRTPAQAHAILRMLATVGLSNLSSELRSDSAEENSRQMMEYQLQIIRRGLEAM